MKHMKRYLPRGTSEYQMYYAAFDVGNYFVIPGYPFGACKLDNSTIVVEKRCGSQWLNINKACPIATHPNAMKL
nr:glycosyl transferase, family 1 [Tanacetum cinerariifolium]